MNEKTKNSGWHYFYTCHPRPRLKPSGVNFSWDPAKMVSVPIFCLCLIILISICTGNVYGEEKMSIKKQVIDLPKPALRGEMSLEETIVKRRSIREYKDKQLNIEQVSQLLWAAQGITDERSGYRAAPSAGAGYPLKIYVAKSDGLFHYIPQGHKLEKLSDKNLRGDLSDAALSQSWVEDAAIDIIITASYSRLSRYGERAVRYADIEVGHVAQNIHLQAVALGLASVPVGAFNDFSVSKVLSLPKDETPLYIIPVGYKK